MTGVRQISEVRERLTRVRRGLAKPRPEMLERALGDLGEASVLLAGLVEQLAGGGPDSGTRPVLQGCLRELAAEIRLTEILLAGASEIAAGQGQVRRETESPLSYSVEGGHIAPAAGPGRSIYG